MSDDVDLEALTKRIRERLGTSKFCIVFENELERVWPTDNALREKRAALIHAYAKAERLVSYCERPRDARHVQEAFLKLYHYPISSYLKCSQYFIRMDDENCSPPFKIESWGYPS